MTTQHNERLFARFVLFTCSVMTCCGAFAQHTLDVNAAHRETPAEGSDTVLVEDASYLDTASGYAPLGQACDTCGSSCDAMPGAYDGNVSCDSGCAAAPMGSDPSCAGSHQVLFYANDFSYLRDPCYDGCCLGDCLKRRPVRGGDWGVADVGGELRLRYHHEEGMGRQTGRVGFEDTKNDFLLTRLRLYKNWELNDSVRVFAEGIFADVLANDLYVPRPIDRNSADFLNLFVDLRLTENWSARLGRQELLFGAQRTVSPLDWANTRRTFEGLRVTSKYAGWTVDSFYTHFVPVSADNFDDADEDQYFGGMYATRKTEKGTTLDAYYLQYEHETVGTPVATNFDLHTFGGRVNGKFKNVPLMYDVEGAYQFGDQDGLGVDHSAGFITVGLGHTFEDTCWAPTLWCYFDYASGNDPADGDFNRFNQLFPLAHKYLGFIDAVARSNVMSPNCLLTMKPSKKLSLLAWYYYIGADQASDVIPGVAVPSNQNLVSDDFGNELDLIANYKFGPRASLLLGYSKLWRGDKIVGTNDASFFYSQYTLFF